MTRSSYLLVRFLYKAWYFGVFYYFASWFFLLVGFHFFSYPEYPQLFRLPN